MMSRNRLFILLAIAVVALAAAALITHLRQGAAQEDVGSRVLPALTGALNDVTEVRILTAGNTPLVTVRRDAEGGQWRVPERGGYRADVSKLREFLLKLSELQVVETKTANPASYPQLGVEDVDAATATGKRIEIAGLPSPLALILGKSTSHGSQYLRVAGEDTSYLARPQVTVYSEPQVWLERALLDIPTERVQAVRLALTAGPADERRYTVTRELREQTDFTVEGLPRGRKLTYSGAANANADALAGLSFEDVRAAQDDEDWADAARAQFRLFDGTVVTVLGRAEETDDAGGYGGGEKHYVRIEASFDEAQHQRFRQKLAEAQEPPENSAAQAPADAETVRAEVEELQDKLDGWVYEVPAYKYDAIFRALDTLTEKS